MTDIRGILTGPEAASDNESAFWRANQPIVSDETAGLFATVKLQRLPGGADPQAARPGSRPLGARLGRRCGSSTGRPTRA